MDVENVSVSADGSDGDGDGEGGYRALFEHSPQAMWVFDPATLRFLAVNAAAVSQYGYSADEFLQMTIADIRPPDDVQAGRQLPNLRQALSAVRACCAGQAGRSLPAL